MENLINFLFPPECMFCKRIGYVLCKDCLAECRVVFDETCIVCQQESDGGITHLECLKGYAPRSLFCCFEYTGVVRDCILNSKYKNMEFAALKVLAEEGASFVYDLGATYSSFIVIPVPLSRTRERERGFNQSEVIARVLARKFGLKMRNDILVRVKDTKSQFEIGREERFKNMENAFAFRTLLKGEKILLVDDICTTGATFIEASKTLYKAGAKEVSCFALSKKI